MASWLAVLPHTNKAQNSNPPPNLGLSLWGLHFSLTFQLHGSITHLRTVASITLFNIWNFKRFCALKLKQPVSLVPK